MSEASVSKRKPYNGIESAAVAAALERAQTGEPVPVDAEPAAHLTDAQPTGVSRVLRHRLRLDSLGRPVFIRAETDCLHPLLPDSKHYRAVALSITDGNDTLDLLAAYDDGLQLVFNVIAPCPYCSVPVPTEEVNSLEDLGDFLLQARDALGGSPRYRRSPAHAAGCRAHAG